MAEPNYTMGTVNMQNTNPVPNNPPVQSTPATQADLNAFNQSLVVPKASNKANLSTITNSPQIKGDLTTPTTPVPSTAGVSSYAQLAQDALKNIQNQTNQQENAYTSIIDQYKTAQAATEGKNQFTQDLNNQYGVNTKAQAVQDIVNQIQANDAALNQQKIGYGLNVGGLTASSQQAFNSEAERANTVKQLGLGASLAAAQGNLALAQNFVNQAVAAKYDDAEAKLKNLKDSYLMNKDELERVNKKAYDQQLMTLNAKQKDLEQQKKDYSDVQNLIINASSQGAPADLVQKASQAKTPMEAAKTLGVYAGDYLKTQLLKEQILNARADRMKTYAEITAKTQGGGSIQSNLQAGLISPGQVVSKATGLPPKGLSDAKIDGLAALKDLTSKVQQYKDLFKIAQNEGLGKITGTGLLKGVGNTLAPSTTATQLDLLRGEITDLLARARSGAALTAYETAQYEEKLPSLYASDQFFGNPNTRINSMQKSLSDTLKTRTDALGVTFAQSLEDSYVDHITNDVKNVDTTQNQYNDYANQVYQPKK